MSVESLLRAYLSTDDTELECRSSVNAATIKRLLTKFRENMSLEQSINFVASGEVTKLCRCVFVDGVKQSTTYASKRRLGVYNITPSVKLVLSKEQDIPAFNINTCTFARIKLRISSRSSNMPDWRLDLTLTRTVTNITKDLLGDKKKMLYPITVENFMTMAPWDFATGFEFELEHVGKDKKVEASTIKQMLGMIFDSPDDKTQPLVYKIASIMLGRDAVEYKQKKSMRDLCNRVWELSRKSYYEEVFPKITSFYLLDKADGLRTIILIEGKQIQALSDKVVSLTATRESKVCVADAEFVEGVYYIFDVMVFEGNNLMLRNTSERVSHINSIATLHESFAAKPMVKLTSNYAKEIQAVVAAERPYERDGMIFTPASGPYSTMRSWKWKPVNHMSIDFLVRAPGSLVGVEPFVEIPDHKLYLLFVATDKRQFDSLHMMQLPGYAKLFPNQSIAGKFPIQFSPSDDPYAYIYYHPNDAKIQAIDNLICEFRRTDKWIFMRVRSDKTADLRAGRDFGNSFYVAEYTWQNYQNPLQLEDLVTPQKGYFKEEKDSKWRNGIMLNSFVKGKLIEKIRNVDWLVDLAAGHGQDLFRVSDAGIKNALFIDSDSQALSELVSRKHTSKVRTRVFTKIVNLNESLDIILAAIGRSAPIGGVDAIMCNFAIHYLIATPTHIGKIIELIKTILKPGGCFFFTAFDGQTIFNKLADTGRWEVREGEVLKYSIIKKYTSDKFERTGQSIGVLLPFSSGEHYTENLVNFDFIIRQFVKNGFTEAGSSTFDAFAPEFRKERKVNLSANELEFASFYRYAMLRYGDSKDGKAKHWADDLSSAYEDDVLIELQPDDKLRQLFPPTKKPLFIVKESIYSITAKNIAEQISIDCVEMLPIATTITDATANVGGNTINFAGHFNSVNAIEINPVTCDALRRNIAAYELANVTVYCDSYMNTDLKHDVVFFDPPWGGTDYKSAARMMLYLGTTPIYTIVNEAKAKLIVLKCPGNFDIDLFREHVKDTIVVKKYAKFQVLYIKRITGAGESAKPIDLVMNKYPHKEIFTELFYKYDTGPVIETVDDIKYSLPYVESSRLVRLQEHIGQRKLWLSEIQGLSKADYPYCLYAGSSPGHKNHLLARQFPNTKFILVDPNKFDIVVNNETHRNSPHPDIVHIYHHYPTKSNTYGDKKVTDMDEKEVNAMMRFITSTNYKIYIIEDYMNDKTAEIIKRLDNMCFISDIRSNVGLSITGSPSDYDIFWNTAMMFNWMQIMRPAYSVLKIRMPYGNDPLPRKCLNPEDFATAKKYGIDFMQDYLDNKFKMCRSVLYVQAWAGISSSELRMHVRQEDLNNIVEYDVANIEGKMAYFNTCDRGWVVHPNPNADKRLGFCYCNDCALENKILTDCKFNVKATVREIGSITHRPLTKVHVHNIWKPSKDDTSMIALIKGYRLRPPKQNVKFGVNRGELGQG